MMRWLRGPTWAPGNKAGLSLLEVLIGTALLGVVALAIFTAFAIGVRALALAGGMNTALGIAEETLAAARAGSCLPPSAADLAELPAGPKAYRREVTITPLSAPGQWAIDVTVTWSQERMRRSVSLSTLRYRSRACEYAAP